MLPLPLLSPRLLPPPLLVTPTPCHALQASVQDELRARLQRRQRTLNGELDEEEQRQARVAQPQRAVIRAVPSNVSEPHAASP